MFHIDSTSAPEKYQLKLGKKMMEMNRKQAVILSFCENCIWGGAADAIV